MTGRGEKGYEAENDGEIDVSYEGPSNRIKIRHGEILESGGFKTTKVNNVQFNYYLYTLTYFSESLCGLTKALESGMAVQLVTFSELDPDRGILFDLELLRDYLGPIEKFYI